MSHRIPTSLLALTASVLASSLSAQTWLNVNPAANPGSRSWHAMAYDAMAKKTILFGGQTGLNSPGYTLKDETWAFDGTNWTQMTPATKPTARVSSTMTYMGNGKCVLFGGYGYSTSLSTSTALSETWIWDGSNWQQASPLNYPAGRLRHVMAYDSNRNRVVMFGGTTSPYHTGLGTAMTDTWEYDGTDWTQVSTANHPHKVTVVGGVTYIDDLGIGSAMCFDSTRNVCVFYGGQSGGTVTSTDTWEYNGTNWTNVGPGGSALVNAGPGVSGMAYGSMVYDTFNHRSVLYGCYDPGGFTLSPQTWAYDGNAWTKLPEPATASPSPRRIGQAMTYHAARIEPVLFGGQSPGGYQATLGDTYTLSPDLYPSYGSGCPSSLGSPPILGAAPGSLPTTGSTFLIEASNLPAASPGGFLVIGLNDQIWTGVGLPLPFDLTGLGIPGCTWLSSAEVTLFLPNIGGKLSYSFGPLPPGYVGTKFYIQAAVIEKIPAIKSEFSFTSGRKMVVGP